MTQLCFTCEDREMNHTYAMVQRQWYRRQPTTYPIPTEWNELGGAVKQYEDEALTRRNLHQWLHQVQQAT